MHPLFVANWKMNMVRATAYEFASRFLEDFNPLPDSRVDVVISPPFPLLGTLADALSKASGVALGAQNVHWLESGAHTGEVSATLLRDFGVTFPIIGHSERRQFYGEHDETVAKRARGAIDHGLQVIVCVGESTHFDSDAAHEVIREQLEVSLAGLEGRDASRLILAYEPVWAIGTGRAATPEIVARVHSFIRGELVKKFNALGMSVPILYGGSTTPENIGELLAQPNVCGALVGGASLKPDVFNRLVIAGREGFR